MLGGLFLIYLGINGLTPRPLAAAASVNAPGPDVNHRGDLSAHHCEPATIMSFAAIFAGLGLAAAGDDWRGALLVSGVFIGSLAWWFFSESGLVSLLRSRLPSGFSAIVARVSALILIVFGLVAIVHAA